MLSGSRVPSTIQLTGHSSGRGGGVTSLSTNLTSSLTSDWSDRRTEGWTLEQRRHAELYRSAVVSADQQWTGRARLASVWTDHCVLRVGLNLWRVICAASGQRAEAGQFQSRSWTMQWEGGRSTLSGNS